MRLSTLCRRLLTIGVVLVASLSGAPQTSAQNRGGIDITPQIPHSATIRSVAFSRDGKFFLSGGEDQTIKLWDADTSMLIRTYEGHAKSVSSVAYSPDATRLLSASGDGVLKLWDVATGHAILSIDGHASEINSVAFSPDGKRLLSGSTDRTLKLWDTSTGMLIRTYEGHTDSISAVAYSPDAARLLSAGSDRTLKLWNVTTGQLIRTYEGHLSSINTVAFAPDGKRLLSGGSDNALKIWDTNTGRLIHALEANNWVLSAAFSPDGTRVLSSNWGRDKSIQLWDVIAGRLMHTYEGRIGPVYSVAFAPDGRRMLSGSEDGTLRLWDISTSRPIRTHDSSRRGVNAIAISPDGTRLLSGSSDRTLKLWDASTAQLVHVIEGHDEDIRSVAFSPDGTRLLSGGRDMALKLWDASNGRLIRSYVGTSESVAFSPDGKRLLQGGESNILKLWDAVTGREIHRLEDYAGMITSVAFSADGKQVLASHFSGRLNVWDAITGQLIRSANAGDWGPSIAMSPDGTRILLGGSSDTLKLFDTSTGQLMKAITGAGWVQSVAFSPDGATVVSGGIEKTIKQWDVETGGLIRTFEGHTGSVKSLAFSRDGRRVVSGSTDTTTRIWDVASGAQLVTLIGNRDGRWLALAPTGFFSGSPQVNQLLAVMRGLESTAIEQLHQSLFNPDLVQETLAGDPNGEVREAAKIISLDKVLESGPAPKVTIKTPADKAQSRSDVVKVTAEVQGRGKGVGRIEWRVNGITAAVTANPQDRSSITTVTQHLALDSGDNIVEVVAYNGANLLASLPARTTVKFNNSASRTKQKLHVLAIGINAYGDKGWAPERADPAAFSPLGLAVRDAQAFSDAIRKAASGLYDEVRVSLALDQDATRNNLETAITKIATEIQRRDSFILFAAGHGTSENGRFYFIPQDYQSGPGHLSQYAVGQDRLQDWLANRIKARHAIVLLDTCESGSLVAGHARSRTDAPASEAGIGRLHEATGRPILTAAAAGQFAHEGMIGATGERHGVFTWALLDALRNGDANGNGLIELSELVRHVQSVVPKVAIELGGIGRAASSEPVFGKQMARFGSRGEDFAVARRLD